MQVAAGSNSSLTGQSPALVVEEMQSGRPSYTASYKPAQTGPYQVAVTQLLPGGLSATYWDNAWLLGAPAVQRVDAQVNAKLTHLGCFDVHHYSKIVHVVLRYTLYTSLRGFIFGTSLEMSSLWIQRCLGFSDMTNKRSGFNCGLAVESMISSNQRNNNHRTDAAIEKTEQ